MFDLTGLILKPGKCGCEGCVFDDEADCPGWSTKMDDKEKFKACTENGTHMIYVKGDNDGARV